MTDAPGQAIKHVKYVSPSQSDYKLINIKLMKFKTVLKNYTSNFIWVSKLPRDFEKENNDWELIQLI